MKYFKITDTRTGTKYRGVAASRTKMKGQLPRWDHLAQEYRSFWDVKESTLRDTSDPPWAPDRLEEYEA